MAVKVGKTMVLKTLSAMWLAGFLVASQSALATDSDVIREQVRFFLANADDEAAHASFWADDLVYTSSAGLRFGKADIMSGFQNATAEDNDRHDEPGIQYSGQNIDVRIYGDTAVVTFKLVGRPAGGTALLSYFNTGVLYCRDGRWRVVAWQATKIPEA